MMPIISIGEARKILGKEAANLTDAELLKLIEDLDFLAKYALDQYKREQLANL